jgi:hypothetical protein
VDQAENCGVGADAEREDDDGCGGESGGFKKLPERRT